MNTTADLPPALPAREGGGALVGIARAWNRFWFSPADPLPLGVIRVFTGLVILYLHRINSLDLLSLVGPNGWLNLSPDGPVNYLRYKTPYYGVGMNWTDMPTQPYAVGQ